MNPELIERYSIKINPMYVILGDVSYRDGIDVEPDDLYSYYKTSGKLPKTAAIGISDHIEFFKPFVDSGYTVIYFTISSSISANFNNALLAAASLSNIYIVDSANLSTGIGLLVVAAAEMANSGINAKNIYSTIIDKRSKIDASFVVDTLEYLNKGGRCSAVAALGANLLRLKPCIEVKMGALWMLKKSIGVNS